MKYNISLEVAAIFFTAIMYIFLCLQYKHGSRVNQKFRVLTLSVLAANILDVATAVTISYGTAVPSLFNLLLNTVYLVTDALVGYFFLSYVYAYVSPEGEEAAGHRAVRILVGVYIASFLVNLFTKHYIYFDSEGNYQHGPLYPVLFLMPVFCIAIAALVMWRNRDHFQRKQQICIAIFIAVVFCGNVGQALLFPDVLLGLFAASLGILIDTFALETPDYEKLTETLAVLEQTKEEAEREKENALAADKAKSEFLANMSHELRTPLNAVLGYNGLILSGTKEHHTAEYAAKVQAAGRTLLSIISDILDFSVLDEGKLKLHLAPYSADSLFQDVTAYAEYYTEKKGLRLHLDIDGNIPRQLLGDVARLTQMINNLISNAAKYTKQGYVELGVRWEPKDASSGRLSVSVKDSGIGMHREDIRRISECFTRLENKDNNSIQGLGLGLSIVTRLLHLMGGELEVESEYEQGSTFSFSIEQKIMEAEPLGAFVRARDCEPEETKEEETLLAPEAKILAVDDNVMNQDLFVSLLRETGVQVDTAGDGKEALELLEKKQYHLIFMDHMMPVMDGITALHEMRRRGLAKDVPVIALTANAVAGARDEYRRQGFDEYMSKPIIGKQLVRTVRKYLPGYLIVKESEAKQRAKGISARQRFSFLDIDMAMRYLGDSEEFYEEMLRSYLDNNRKDEIQEYYERREWDDYCNAVHALKSTSLTVGAVGLSGAAKEMEIAVKDGDLVFIEENHDSMIREYEQLLMQIRKALAVGKISRSAGELPASAHILVVDDDPMNLRIAQKMLEEFYSVDCVNSGMEALKYLRRKRPDLILLDLHMPELDGFEVMNQIRMDESLCEIPVIFLTADDDKVTEVRGFRAGAMDFITKPFVADLMVARVKRILELGYLRKKQ